MALVPGSRNLFILCARCDNFFEEGTGGACQRCGSPPPSTASEERWWDLHAWLAEDLDEAARLSRICVHGCPFHSIEARHGLSIRMSIWRRCGLDWYLRRVQHHDPVGEFTFKNGKPEWIDLSSEEDEWQPCRWCGGWDLEVEEIGSDSDAIPIHSVRCLSCGHSGPRLVGPKQNAWDAWDEKEEEFSRDDLSPHMRGYRKGTEPPARGPEISSTLASPCPFCGSLPQWADSLLTCPHCEAGRWTRDFGFVEALRRWNRRETSA